MATKGEQLLRWLDGQTVRDDPVGDVARLWRLGLLDLSVASHRAGVRAAHEALRSEDDITEEERSGANA